MDGNLTISEKLAALRNSFKSQITPSGTNISTNKSNSQESIFSLAPSEANKNSVATATSAHKRAGELEVQPSPVKDWTYPPATKKSIQKLSQLNAEPLATMGDFPGNWKDVIPDYEPPIPPTLESTTSNPIESELQRLMEPSLTVHSVSHYAFSGIPLTKPEEAITAVYKCSVKMSLGLSRDDISSAFDDPIFQLESCETGTVLSNFPRFSMSSYRENKHISQLILLFPNLLNTHGPSRDCSE